jgi:hypothetical protein
MARSIPFFFLLFFTGLISAKGQSTQNILSHGINDILPHYINVLLEKAKPGDSVSLPGELRQLDSLRLKALDSLHHSFPHFTFALANTTSSATTSPNATSSGTTSPNTTSSGTTSPNTTSADNPHTESQIPQLSLAYKVVLSDNSTAPNMVMGLPNQAFMYTIEQRIFNGNTHQLLQYSAEIMKDLEASLDPQDQSGLLYKDIYKKMKAQITAYVIDTKQVLPPEQPAAASISIRYDGITGPNLLLPADQFTLNALMNNILVNGQHTFSYHYIPAWATTGSLQSHHPSPDSLIRLSLSLKDSADQLIITIRFDSKLNLHFENAYNTYPVRISGEVHKQLNMPKHDLASKELSAFIFGIAGSMNKFFIYNIPYR